MKRKAGMEIPKSKYIGVIGEISGHRNVFAWRAQFTINGKISVKRFRHSQEREAALWYDKKRIEHELEPVNILKRK